MAEIRFNYGDKFTQTTNTNTGIGSTNPVAKLDIAGGASAGSLRVSGIATLPSYQGFVNTKLTTPTEGMIVEAGQSGSVSGEVVIGTGQTISVSTGATTGQGGIQSLKVYQTFMPPVGGTADRPTDVKPGMLYYNKDFKTIEFWDGNFWKQVDNVIRRGRGVIAGGYIAPARVDPIEFIEISTLGNGIDFGDLNDEKAQPGPAADSTRGLFCGGMTPSASNQIEYITIASRGDGIDFGDLTRGTNSPGALSSSTRCVTAGGSTPSASNVIDFFEIQTLGNAVDFGDMTSTTAGGGGLSSPVRGVFSGGYSGDRTRIDFMTIASKGNAIRFGELSRGRGGAATGGNATRGITATGDGNGHQNTIDYITIASTGNAVDFGDAMQTHTELMGSNSSNVRMVFSGGNAPGSSYNIEQIEFITIATKGDAQDFGKLHVPRRGPSSLSDSHGGLGGF